MLLRGRLRRLRLLLLWRRLRRLRLLRRRRWRAGLMLLRGRLRRLRLLLLWRRLWRLYLMLLQRRWLTSAPAVASSPSHVRFVAPARPGAGPRAAPPGSVQRP